MEGEVKSALYQIDLIFCIYSSSGPHLCQDCGAAFRDLQIPSHAPMYWQTMASNYWPW